MYYQDLWKYICGQAKNAQTICKIIATLHIDNKKSKISNNFITVLVILLHSAIIVWHIMHINTTVNNCYLLLLL